MHLKADFLHDAGLRTVLTMLEDAGFRALIVGGAVRNALMGQPVSDIDLSTDAAPETVMRLAGQAGLHTVPTGLDHGTVTIIADGTGYEITTFRRDVATDGRRAQVAWAASLDEDAARRDFTMNALYADRHGKVFDPVGGLPDLRAGRLRFVGDPAARIAEDYLRILRFFRFHAHYGRAGGADAAALAACADGRAGLQAISKERIGHEMRKLLAAPDPSEALGLMQETGVLAQILPRASAQAIPALITAELALDMPPDWQRRLAALGGDNPVFALRLSRPEARRQARLAAACEQTPAQAAFYHGADLARDAVLLAQASGRRIPSGWREQIAAARPLPIRAADLAPLTGPALGEALRRAERAWIASGFRASSAALVAWALETPAGSD